MNVRFLKVSRRELATVPLTALLISFVLLSAVNGAQAATANFPEPKYVETNGIRMAYYEQGEGFPVIFSHGFPELAYSWRYQLDALAKAGFRAIAPDQRGYGLTDQPEELTSYDMHHLTGDLVGLMDALNIEKAVFCGHDWGGAVVWNMATLHPDRVAGVIGVNTPHNARGPMAPVEMLTRMRGENNYIVTFQEPGKAEKILEKDVEKTFRLFLRKNNMTAKEFAKLPADAPERSFDLLSMLQSDAANITGETLISDKDLQVYIDTYTKTGFTGGVNWYRNIDRNWETTEGVSAKIDKPCLYVGAEDDVVLPPSMAANMGNLIADLEKKVIPECGHWTQQQKPDELNAILVDWLTRKFGPKGK
jgi:pimeloyl-ACP methyl ester carboxylesterase